MWIRVGQHRRQEAVGAWKRAQSLDKLIAHANRDEASKRVTLGLWDTDRSVPGPCKVLGSRHQLVENPLE